MAFTDEDFRRLKDSAKAERWEGALVSLLKRLEAAENIVNRPCMNECGGCYCKQNRELWKKSCGK